MLGLKISIVYDIRGYVHSRLKTATDQTLRMETTDLKNRAFWKPLAAIMFS